MTIPVSSGTIAASQIRSEFGPSGSGNQISLGNYRVSFNNTNEEGTLENFPLDEGIPQGNNPIAMSNFYSKSLNIVVDVHSGGDQYGVNAKSKYNATNPAKHTVIGGFKGKQISGARIIINVNKRLGSHAPTGGFNKNADTASSKCALRTGTWSGAAKVEVRFGNDAKLYGAGGKGGNGSNSNGAKGERGGHGGSGFGVQHAGTLLYLSSGTQIKRGFGGGGGGGHANETSKNNRSASGGGGGGGAGFPPGFRGNKGTDGADGANGNSANLTKHGNGGNGGNNDNEAFGGAGERGADSEAPTAQPGDSGNGEGEGESEGGAGGDNGTGIRSTVGGSGNGSNSTYLFVTGGTGTVDDKDSPGTNVT